MTRFIFYQLSYYPCLMTSNAHFSGGTGPNLDRNLKAKLKPLSYRVKRSISDKSPSRQDKSAQRKLDLAAKLRLEPNTIETVNAYFGLIQRRKPKNGHSVFPKDKDPGAFRDRLARQRQRSRSIIQSKAVHIRRITVETGQVGSKKTRLSSKIKT